MSHSYVPSSSGMFYNSTPIATNPMAMATAASSGPPHQQQQQHQQASPPQPPEHLSAPMNTPMMVVPPLRIPVDHGLDLPNMIQGWMEVHGARIQLTWDECYEDWLRFGRLRHQCEQVLMGASYERALGALPVLQEYAAACLAFEERGFVFTVEDDEDDDDEQQQQQLEEEQQGTDANQNSENWNDPGPAATHARSATETTHPRRTVRSSSNGSQRPHSFPDQIDDEDETIPHPTKRPFIFRWMTADMDAPEGGAGTDGVPCDAYCTLLWERANIVWNITALEAYQATTKNLTTKTGCGQAGQHFSYAAALVRQLQRELYGTPEEGAVQKPPRDPGVALSETVLQIWERYLTAEAQRAAYSAFLTLPRQRHNILAKLAAASVPLYNDLETLLANRIEEQQDNLLLLQGQSADPILENKLMDWDDTVRALNMWMSVVTEYHQSVVHREMKEWGSELSRLECAIRYGHLCQEFCENSEYPPGSGLENMNALMEEMERRYQEADQENQNLHRVDVPDRDDLPEIPMQNSVKEDPDISRILPALSKPFFTSLMNPTMRYHVQLFRAEMEKIVAQTAQVGEEKTEKARKALAAVNLPHSLTAYRQEQSGGGLPNDLWERIESLQAERRDDRLKQELWELRDLAELARATFKTIEMQLEEDLQMDSLFREQHGSHFEGHDVSAIQKTFRKTLGNYDRLLSSAEASDSLLQQRCEILDTDPKFRLLKFPKHHLDRLLPGQGPGDMLDVSSLGRHLVDLSMLFNERDALVHTLRERVKTFDIATKLGDAETEEEYEYIVEESIASFNGLIRSMQESIMFQEQLMGVILRENEDFMRARERTRSKSTSENIIIRIEDALEDIDQFSDHLREGRAFYDVIIPKLNKLKQQVGDVSARLAIERCEFDDKVRRFRQEAEDARVAASYGSSRQPSHTNDSQPSGLGGPGAREVSQQEPEVYVDDEKVASLVAMDFDPEQVVAALKKYNNNLDQALNDLLGC